jgi:hypothetical protein
MNLARLVAMRADCPETTCGLTINFFNLREAWLEEHPGQCLRPLRSSPGAMAYPGERHDVLAVRSLSGIPMASPAPASLDTR